MLTRLCWQTGRYPSCRRTGRSDTPVWCMAHRWVCSHRTGSSSPCTSRRPEQPFFAEYCDASTQRQLLVAFCRAMSGRLIKSQPHRSMKDRDEPGVFRLHVTHVCAGLPVKSNRMISQSLRLKTIGCIGGASTIVGSSTGNIPDSRAHSVQYEYEYIMGI